MFPRYSRGERIADAVVHALGAALGFAACAALAATALPRLGEDPPRALGAAVYAAGLVAMLTCSALYNMAPDGAPRKMLLRRFDRAAVFVMIAATYTPFAVGPLRGAWGMGLLAGIWAGAAAGALLELFLPWRRPEHMAVSIYLLLGWSGLVALGPLVNALSLAGLALLAAGGLLYSVGAAFHLAIRLPYHNAIWHALVLAAAACHFTAVLTDVVLTG